MGSAMLIATYDYWGYYNVCFLGGEVKDPGRTIPRALIISILASLRFTWSMNIAVLGVIPWRETGVAFRRSRTTTSSRCSCSAFMAAWAGRVSSRAHHVDGVCLGVFMLLGYSRVPYAAALDGNYFRAFARVDPKRRFPTVSLLALGGVAMLFCFLRLADVIAALVVIRILLQFIVQAVGVIVLRHRRPDMPRPFRMWLYPAAGADGDCGIHLHSAGAQKLPARDSLCSRDLDVGIGDLSGALVAAARVAVCASQARLSSSKLRSDKRWPTFRRDWSRFRSPSERL